MQYTSLYKTNPIPCILGNKPYVGANQFDVYRVDTPNQEIFHQVSSCSVEDANKIVEAAHSAFAAWRKSSIETRKQIIFRAIELIKANIDEHVAIVEASTCVTGGFAHIDQMFIACTQLEQVAKDMETGLASNRLEDENGVARYVFREPFGVVLGIAPWNCPFYLALRSVMYPIFSGNTAVLKTSEHACQVQNMVAACLYEAGLPPNVLNVAHVAPEDASVVTEAFIAHRRVRKVNFTGSARVGAMIASTAGRHLTPTCMELGGRSAMIVSDDADLDLAAQHMIFGGYLNSNQICMAVNNILVHKSVAEELFERVKSIFAAKKAILTAQREPTSQGTHRIRPLFSKASGERVKELYEDAIAKGACVLAGTPGFDGSLVQPLVLASVDERMRIYNEETFGPILAMTTFTDINEAVRKCNDSEYALSSCVFGRDLDRATAIARSLETAMVHVNANSIADDPAMPHGGWKESGWGQLSGSWTEFTHTQVVTVQNGNPVPLEAL